MTGSGRVVEASVAAACAERFLRLRSREGGQPVQELGATDSERACHRLLSDVPGDAERAPPHAPSGAPLAGPLLPARKEGLLARPGKRDRVRQGRLVPAAGGPPAAFGRPAPGLSGVRNRREPGAAVDFLLLREAA